MSHIAAQPIVKLYFINRAKIRPTTIHRSETFLRLLQKLMNHPLLHLAIYTESCWAHANLLNHRCTHVQDVCFTDVPIVGYRFWFCIISQNIYVIVLAAEQQNVNKFMLLSNRYSKTPQKFNLLNEILSCHLSLNQLIQ